MRAWVVLLSPAFVVSCVGLVMLWRQTRGTAKAPRQSLRFLLYVVGGGCMGVILMVIAIVILMAAAHGVLAPLWLIFAPWGFAIGEAVGLVSWKWRVTRAAARIG
ncbi:MAG: hypothetical protein WB995_07535 [Candidatus Acidiferrales bacterium]